MLELLFKGKVRADTTWYHLYQYKSCQNEGKECLIIFGIPVTDLSGVMNSHVTKYPQCIFETMPDLLFIFVVLIIK